MKKETSNNREMGLDLTNFPFENLYQHFLNQAEKCLEKAFDTRLEFFAYEFTRHILPYTKSDSEIGKISENWFKIQSFSQLRSLVGGRFQNLKERWSNAGFPLKEHRGDTLEEFKINEAGWAEMKEWLLKHGYIARLSEEDSACAFEMKKIVTVEPPFNKIPKE